MTKMNIVEPRLKSFVGWMRRKLEANQHKTDWRDMRRDQLLGCIKAELRELELALGQKHAPSIVEECADVANFAMMLADNVQPSADYSPAYRVTEEDARSLRVAMLDNWHDSAEDKSLPWAEIVNKWLGTLPDFPASSLRERGEGKRSTLDQYIERAKRNFCTCGICLDLADEPPPALRPRYEGVGE
jgi:hypothetical protein